MNSPLAPIECAGCHRSFSVLVRACPFCGRPRDATSPAAGTPAVPPADPPPPARLPPVIARPPSQATVPCGPTCVLCQTQAASVKVRIETWEDQGVTLTMDQKFTVRSLDAPCFCPTCFKALFRKRLLATLLVASPVFLLGLFGPESMPTLVLGGLYFLYLIRWTEYTWADQWLYGFELETAAANWIPEGGGPHARVKFPLGCLHLIGRLGLAAILGFVGLGIGATFPH